MWVDRIIYNYFINYFKLMDSNEDILVKLLKKIEYPYLDIIDEEEFLLKISSPSKERYNIIDWILNK